MKVINKSVSTIKTLEDLAPLADYSLLKTLNCDPEATKDGIDHFPREVFTGHYVPVKPTPIPKPQYIAHSKTFFKELGFADSLAKEDGFIKMFSGDTSSLPAPLKNNAWACGYALSIFGTEYYHQCPFRTGNGYGDGRAISILEAKINDQRWEMQLKGGGRTPYCRGADGRAVLRSSVREFLAQDHMYALGVSTSRSLCLYTSNIEKVSRPWFKEESYSVDPEVMISENVAITTRVAPSFIRVGQIELFGRRARKEEHPTAMKELEQIVLHVIEREYKDVIDKDLSIAQKVVLLASEFRARLTSLIANWIRVGYCQGNFNSDNCSLGGFTLDYGPFGFCDVYEPMYQPWTSGGDHFAFLNQPQAASRNFHSFCIAIEPLLSEHEEEQIQFKKIRNDFASIMQEELQKMWASKLGLRSFNANLLEELQVLMMRTSLDYTIFFRELSEIPQDISPLKKSFYKSIDDNQDIQKSWTQWLEKWKSLIKNTNTIDLNASTKESLEKLSKKMKLVNPKYTLREWLLVPAYKQAQEQNYTLIHELQDIMTKPYDEQSKDIEDKYYKLKPSKYFEIAGISHVSCSS